MKTTRRSFFKLLAGAAVVAASPSLALNLANIPVIYADGVHDDSEGFQALLEGGVVEFKSPELAKEIGWRGDTLYMGNVTLTTNKTIILNERFSGKTLSGGTYKCNGQMFMDSDGCQYAKAQNMTIRNTSGMWLDPHT
jgi:hypothetical protein